MSHDHNHEYTAEQLKEMIRAAGLRCTNSRAIVLERLVEAPAPMSHAELTEQLVPEGFDQATIYRNLTDLAESGLLQRLDPGDHIWRFEFRGHHDHEDEHPHFLCNDCGELSCLTSVQISVDDDDKSPPTVGEISAVFLRGRCTHCT